MPSTVTSLFAAAGVRPLDAVPWGVAVSPTAGPGVYAIARHWDPDATTAPKMEVDPLRVSQLLALRTELRVDGVRPCVAELSDRLISLGFSDEPVLYIGLAGSSLHNRLDQFYRTRPGARSPHAGGWPLKYVSELDACWVHLGPCATSTVNRAEFTFLAAFLASVSPQSRAKAVDPTLPLPYANLEIRDADRRTRKRKAHGITGATA